MPTRLAAELLAEESFPGFGERFMWYDAFQTRAGANWLITEAEGELAVGRVADDPSLVLGDVRRWPFPPSAGQQCYASPLPDGGLAVCGGGLVTVYGADGRVRWTHESEAWGGTSASPSCIADPAGTRLLVTVPGPEGAGGIYPGDLCVALDLADGRRVAQAQLPSASAGYAFKQSISHPSQVFLDALQGDTFFTFAVTLQDEHLRAEPVGLPTEVIAGLSLGGAFLQLDVGGEWLSRYEPGQPDVLAEAEEVLPDDLRFVGYRTGFLDKDRVLAAVAEEEDSEDNRHLILDGHTLQPVAEVDYPGTTCYDPLALGDGTWLTTEGDVVRRWRVAGAE
ncbi:hypothetical protein [Streptomyces sp. NBC_00557]|uniref:hypothetical protein n=1 Tax=Streptomyces sp. NBC_00557 TaxID=2975776 RepID=UPI002E807B5D|nr:hypothetical protein [Streptomyces sp. NBC_00557]WUC36251.1 hypothetical protein OG956_19555 [Streptomyces sp. NBC_00557]